MSYLRIKQTPVCCLAVEHRGCGMALFLGARNGAFAALVALLWVIGGIHDTEGAPSVDASEAGVEFFEKKIRPVLVKKCYSCHSAGVKDLKGNLLLDTRAGIRKGGDSGHAVVPGNVEESHCWKFGRQLSNFYTVGK